MGQTVEPQPYPADAAAVTGGAIVAIVPDVIIVIFGAAVRADGQPSNTLRRRVEAAAAFGLRHPGAIYIPTGGVGRHGASEASVMAGLLRGFGVPPERIMLEETGSDTLSSVRAVRHLVRDARLSGQIYAATSGYHLPRCVLLMRLAGVPARACPPPAFPAALKLRTRWFWRLRESAAIPYDAALMMWLRISRQIDRR
jgi:uncharacterized SAM-binding protein YcdF (DUF218 family)